MGLYNKNMIIMTNAAKNLYKKVNICGTTVITTWTSFEQVSEDVPVIKASESNDSYNSMFWWCQKTPSRTFQYWKIIMIFTMDLEVNNSKQIYLMFEADVLRQNIWSYRNEENKFEELQRGKHVLGCFVLHWFLF